MVNLLLKCPSMRKIIGFDNSTELLKLLWGYWRQVILIMLNLFCYHKRRNAFSDGEFDLIYDRRGPTSIINHSRILKSGGTIFGIHNSVDKVEDYLHQNRFKILKSKNIMKQLHISQIVLNLPSSYPVYREIQTLLFQNMKKNWNGRLVRTR